MINAELLVSPKTALHKQLSPFSPLSSLFGRKSPWTGPTEGVGVRPHFLVGGDVHTLFGTGAVVPCSESHSGSYHMQNEMETPLRGPT